MISGVYEKPIGHYSINQKPSGCSLFGPPFFRPGLLWHTISLLFLCAQFVLKTGSELKKEALRTFCISHFS